MSEFQPRITGTEMEWSVIIQPKEDAEPVQIDEIRDARDRAIVCLPPGLYRAGTYLSNGARYYKDVGHIEYATPESRSIIGTVAEEIAGEEIVLESIKRFVHERKYHAYAVNKRVIDEERDTWGYHVNLNSPVKGLPHQPNYVPLLGLHLATHNIYDGAGAVVRNGRGIMRQTVAQKVLTVNANAYLSSHNKTHPLVSLRDEPLAGAETSRVHITSMDANMSPWATWMKIGTTALVLRLIESGFDPTPLRPKRHMHEMAKRVGFDPHMKARFELASGKMVSALNIQEELFREAHQFALRHDIPAQERDILPEWERALADLAVDPLLLNDRADWVAKKIILDAYMEKHGLRLDSKEVRDKDLQFDLLAAAGFGLKLRQKRWAEWMPPAERIARAKTKPPRNTRARLRGRFVYAYATQRNKGGALNVDWGSIGYDGTSAALPDPYKSKSARADHVIGLIPK